jgi:phosphatidylinositol glycan class M
LLHPILGKLTFSILSLAVPLILLSGPSPSPFWPTHLLWTLNPFVLNITTRGSPEAIIVLLVAATLTCLRRASVSVTANGNSKGKQNKSGSGSEEQKWEMGAAVMYALAVSWKIYPVIYAPAIWAHLAQKHGWLGREVWMFGLGALSTLVLVNGALWSM